MRLTDFRFWVLLFFVIRLYGITNPPLEGAHSWRQVTVNMVARNFLEIDSNILYPRVDMAGEKTGITGMEFPLLNYLIFLISKLFGFAHWYGRLLNLVVSSIGVYFFYLLIKKYFQPKLAFYAGIILLSSIWFNYSRKIMPDTFSVSFVLISIYYALKFLDRGTYWRLLLFFIFATLGVLSKIPSIYLLTILCIPLFDKNILIKRKLSVVLAGSGALVIISSWYFYWVPYLVSTYEYWHYYMGTSFIHGFKELITHFDQAAEKFYFDALNYVGFGMFVMGIIFAFIKKNKLLINIFIITTLFFAIFMIKAGYTFAHHSYYIIPYTIIMALIAALPILQIKIIWIRKLILIIIVISGIAAWQHDFRIKKTEVYRLSLESIADNFSARSDLIAINGGANPRDLYFTHRKGWTLGNDEILNIVNIESLIVKGCRYLFINKTYFENPVPQLSYKSIFENDHYIVYKLPTKL